MKKFYNPGAWSGAFTMYIIYMYAQYGMTWLRLVWIHRDNTSIYASTPDISLGIVTR